MAQSAGRGRVVGDYLVGRQIGSGSFSLVWHARHRVHGTEVAIKEIATSKLSKKLQDSLRSEIYILKRINNPNIIHLFDIIEAPGKIHLVLEYCKGGDLSMYINRRGRVPELIAKHFMQQLATGLRVLHDNRLIHRDLKPQNLLLSTNDECSVLKIADFGFARLLQPRNLAETLCGSPLYMAPEIMQLQKYDAKADLWSVGAILYQLVTGKTPFTGNNQLQLLQNIMKPTELQFPPESMDLSFDCKDLCQKLLRRNPVERLTFEEFFNHSFLSQKQPDGSLRTGKFSRTMDSFPLSESDPVKNVEESVHDDCFPFFLDDDCNGSVRSPSFSNRRTSTQLIEGVADPKIDKRESLCAAFGYMDQNSLNSSSSNMKMDNDSFRPDTHRNSDAKPNDPLLDQRPVNTRSRDSMELIDDYVLVPGPPLDVSSSSLSASKTSQFPFKSDSPPQASHEVAPPSSVPVPIGPLSRGNIFRTGSIGNPTVAQGTSFESMDNVDAFEKPLSHCMTRITSLQQFASIIKQLMNEKMEKREHLEAFSIQLVILAIWKQALNICHTEAASAMEGSPSPVTMRLRRSCDKNHCSSSLEVCSNAYNTFGPEEVSTHIEGEFLREVEHAEELAKVIEPGSTEMPDAMEAIFQFALALGRRGGVDELMGDTETAESLYSKAVQLLLFLLVEAPTLILNPPFSLTNSDQYRLRNYIDFLKSRQIHLRSGMALHKSEDQQCRT
ncbi:serine/threonine-protein kinase ATG1c-like isoform X2 [Rhodamnia argentea]|uniref:Serine/threonine-protein kinase ATG1c-like isoform X2 n=1 Tax=Rhodamnia argentea TaxID=178133 RepID=A0A8B8NGS2_9MYRT|nr:serine/threonine-protein kinase ATG1c-like isoform X2 [Rhodamnia argentea]